VGRSVALSRRAAEDDDLMTATAKPRGVLSQHTLRAAKDVQWRNVGKEDDSHRNSLTPFLISERDVI
jgi:hypothetical protein